LVSLEIGVNVLFSTRRLLSQLSDLRSFNCCSPERDCILFFDISNVRSDVILIRKYERLVDNRMLAGDTYSLYTHTYEYKLLLTDKPAWEFPPIHVRLETIYLF